MRQVKVPFVKKVGRRLAPFACVAILGVTASACGSSAKPIQSNTPPAVTTPAGATTPPTTTPPQSGGAGF